MDSTRLAPRRRLSDLVTTGRRKQVRDAVRFTVGGLVLLTILGFALESHRVCEQWHRSSDHDWGGSHSYLSEVGPWPIIVLAVIGVGQWGAHRGRLLLAIGFAIVSLVLTLIVIAKFAFVHLLSHVDGGPIGDALLPLGLLGTLAGAVAQLVVEPWVAVAERRALERGEPVLPGAVVVRAAP